MVVLFLMAVAAVVAAVDGVLGLIYVAGSDARVPVVPAGLYVWGAVITLGMILAVSLINVLRLAGGH